MDLLAVNRRDMSELLFHSSTYMIFSLLVGHFIRLCWIVTGACILRDVCLFSSSLGMPLPAVWSETVFDHRCGHTRAAWSILHWLCAVQTPITGVQEVVENLWAADSLGILVTIHWAHTLVTNQPIIRSCAILIARDLSILLNMHPSWLTGKSQIWVHIGFLWSAWPSVSRKELNRSMRVLKCPDHNGHNSAKMIRCEFPSAFSKAGIWQYLMLVSQYKRSAGK